MNNELARPLTQVLEPALLIGQLTEALAEALDQLSVNEDCNLPILFQGWAALSKAEQQPMSFF